MEHSCRTVRVKNETMDEYTTKIITTQALEYAKKRLLEDEAILKHVEELDFLTEKAINLGEEMYSCLRKIVETKMHVDEKEKPPCNEDTATQAGPSQEIKSEPSISISSSSESSSEREEVKPKPKRQIGLVPYAAKVKAVTLHEQHPKWSLATIAKNSTKFLKHKWQLCKWKRQIEKGEPKLEIYSKIDQCVYNRFVEAKKDRQLVTTRMIRLWAREAVSQFSSSPDFPFKASIRWAARFKSKHNIRCRRRKN